MTFFYPGGSLLMKRIIRISIIFTIGANLYLNELQDVMFEIGEDMIALADTLSQPVAETTRLFQERVLPFLDHVESTSFGRAIIAKFDIPPTNVLRQKLEKIHNARKVLKEYGPLFSLVATVLRYTNWIFFITAGLAILWLFFDLSSQVSSFTKCFVVAGIALSIPLNFLIYMYLHRLLPLPEQIDYFISQYPSIF